MGLKKKKGSTLIIAIMAVGFLAMVGAVVLAISLSDQKLRIQESNNTKNLYSSESGIEVAYKILEGVVKDAVQSGNDNVEKVKNDENNEINKAKLEERNNAYNTFFKDSYSKYIEDNLKNKIETGDYSSAKVEGDIPKVFVSLLNKDNEVFNIQLTSNFTSTKSTNKGSKAINVIYKVKVPQYNRIIKVVENKNNTIPQYNIINNIITCDGDLLVNNQGSLNFNGNIWVNGKALEKAKILNPVKDKYVGGINLVGDGSTSFYGEIMTSSTFGDNGQSEYAGQQNSLEGKLYAGNFYVGKENEKNSGKALKTINAKNSSVYLSNDLCISTLKTSVTLGDFYGLNDKNYEDNGYRYRNSSAIIINSADVGQGGTTLTVDKKAYLMGTAYINTHPDYYQTGESVGVKGNYNAYTKEVNDAKFKNAIFEYKTPLLLITKYSDGKELGLKDKMEYIDLYNKSNSNELDKSGIVLKGANKGDIKSIGAYYDAAGKLQKGNYNDEARAEIDEMKKEFASKVFMMGASANVSDFEIGEVKKTVENQFNWNAIQDIVSRRGSNVIDEALILNGDEKSELVIDVKNDNITIKLNDKEIKKYSTSAKTPIFLVISKGNVRYEVDEASHRVPCAVIAKGDVTVNASRTNTSIGNYDATPIVTKGVNEIIKKHFNDVFRNIFTKEAATNSSVNTIIETEYEIENPATVKDLIVKERWKLEK